MHRSEARELELCVACGAEIDLANNRGYAHDDDRILCHECATKRGGVYDDKRDVWDPVPDLAGLA